MSEFQKISLENNQKWLGWSGELLINEKGKEDSWIGRNYAYKPVIVKGDLKIGDTISVKINNVTWFDLRGKKT